MKKNRIKYISSDKYELLLLIPVIIFVICVYYLRLDVRLSDKWISIAEINENSYINEHHLYCNSYDNIRDEKIKTVAIIFLFGIIMFSLIAFIIYLLKKLRDGKKENNKLIESFNEFKKKEKNETIVSKYETNETELNVQQILNSELKKDIYNMFCKLQIASMNFDYKVLQNLLTKELYDKYYIGLETLKTKSRKNIVDDFEFVSAKFIDTNEDDEKYVIKINLKVKYYGYIMDTSNNQIIKGSRSEKIINNTILTLIKYKKANDKCSSCGAPLEENLICEYCKTKTIKDSSKWIISEKEKVKEC